MSEKEVQRAAHVEQARERNARAAAFFDLDGTLLSLPSLEKRFFSMLRYRRLLGARNYFWWLAEVIRLMPRGIGQCVHANKLYLRGVRVEEALCQVDLLLPRFCPEGIERVAWHAERGESIVIVSGTLEPLASLAGRSLEAELVARGLNCRIRVCATRLEIVERRCTGRIVGEAMFGEAKARALKQIALEMDLDLERCFAYGDSTNDRWMLEAVRRPAAVNPSNDLARIARRNAWAVLRWGNEGNSTHSSQRGQRTEEIRPGLTAENMKSGCGT